MFETRFRVRSTQVDQLGHLNNAAFLEIFEWARWEWGEVGGFDFMQSIREDRVAPVIVHVDISFRREVQFHDQVVIQTCLEHVGDKKGLILQRMMRSDGELASEARLTFVVINLDARRSIPMPEKLIAAWKGDDCGDSAPD